MQDADFLGATSLSIFSNSLLQDSFFTPSLFSGLFPSAWTSPSQAPLSNISDYCQKLVAHFYFKKVILFCSH